MGVIMVPILRVLGPKTIHSPLKWRFSSEMVPSNTLGFLMRWTKMYLTHFSILWGIAVSSERPRVELIENSIPYWVLISLSLTGLWGLSLQLATQRAISSYSDMLVSIQYNVFKLSIKFVLYDQIGHILQYVFDTYNWSFCLIFYVMDLNIIRGSF